jgi:dolichol-phosphate mannosyltransferase
MDESLTLLTVVIPARDEEACVASTVEHLHVELRLHDVPHEIIVVDDGSRDRTWEIINELKPRIPVLTAVQSLSPHGFGRAIIAGLEKCRATRWF